MNLIFFGIIIFVIIFVLLSWFTKTSSKKIAKGVRSVNLYYINNSCCIFCFNRKIPIFSTTIVSSNECFKNKRFNGNPSFSIMAVNLTISKKFGQIFLLWTISTNNFFGHAYHRMKHIKF